MAIRLCARYQWEDTDSPPFLDQTFAGPRVTIGNDPTASLCLNGSVISSEQVVIIEGDAESEVINLADGTSLNGETLELNARRPLRNGDLLCLGTYRINIFFERAPLTASSNQTVQSEAPEIVRRNGDLNTFVEDKFESALPQTENKYSNSALSDERRGGSPTNTNRRVSSTKSFAAILDSLRTDEDRFYFLIEGGKQSGVRVPIELEEMPLGWDETSEYLSFDISTITEFCAVVRKDWSGVILRSQAPVNITVNNEPFHDERRLRDGDRICLAQESRPESAVVLIFREPTSLVILDTLMPRVPPPRDEVASTSAANSQRNRAASFDINRRLQRLVAPFKSDKEYFGAFTSLELTLMGAGTIAGAVIIFLILNYS